MRKICLINENPNSKFSLNLFSRLARNKKKILIVDLRLNKKKSNNNLEIGLNIYNCINEAANPKKFITHLEPNLDIIKGHANLSHQEFNMFYELFKFDYFEKAFKDLNYDYIIFEISPQLNLISTNALFFSNEIQVIVDLDNSNLDLIHKIARFTYHYNKIYNKEILISKIIPHYSNKLKKDKYVHLISEFTSKLVSYPILNSIKNKNLNVELKDVTTSIIDDEKIFDSTISIKGRQKLIKEYLDIISENALPEKPLTKF